MNLKELANKAINEPPDSCYCPNCKSAQWIIRFNSDSDYILGCGHNIYKNGDIWEIK